MCRHCERLVEDVKHKQLMHDFMAVAAEGVNRKLAEDKFPLDHPVTADDIDISINITAYKKSNGLQGFSSNSAVNRLLYRSLTEAIE